MIDRTRCSINEFIVDSKILSSFYHPEYDPRIRKYNLYIELSFLFVEGN